MNKKKVGDAIGVSRTTIQNYEKGQYPKGEYLAALARELDCTADWLLTGATHLHTEARTGGGKALPAAALARYIYNDAEDHPELVMVPKVRAKLNAGGGSLITSDEIVGRFAFRSDWIRLKGDPDRMVLMDVFGESMEPVIWDGDTVLIDQHQTELTPGRIYAVGIDGTVVVKYVDMKPGALILRSANPRWEDIEVSCQDDLEDSVKIIGRVIWWCREAR